ncbi:85/88 kDa calcium-independent phospholipase A2 [Holothuria leucospilota]|uniref:85/88 kDa calcium-independent phospholipase A2 n=1 Tax=Holothuria leucospilota TaxID=206669 RepID=A0A9Q0YRQ5_HOLLE|nr:85/88 kDa calcium-independent phospholipase A2 [Holothuria leucospilota]
MQHPRFSLQKVVMDDGLIANNPPYDAVAEISEYYLHQRMKTPAPCSHTQITDSKFRPTDRVRAWYDDVGAAFSRLSPVLRNTTAIDDTDPTRILRKMWETHVYIHQNMETTEKIGELIN